MEIGLFNSLLEEAKAKGFDYGTQTDQGEIKYFRLSLSNPKKLLAVFDLSDDGWDLDCLLIKM